MVDAPESPQASDLCLSCGLCCSGALFNALSLSPQDFERAIMAGLRVESDPDDPFCIRFPCVALAGASCTVYRQRPEGCRDFRCETLKQLDRDEVSLSQAGTRASLALERFHALRALLAPETVPQYRQRRVAALERGEALPDDAARRALVLLDQVLDAHFRQPAKRQNAKYAKVEGRALED